MPQKSDSEHFNKLNERNIRFILLAEAALHLHQTIGRVTEKSLLAELRTPKYHVCHLNPFVQRPDPDKKLRLRDPLKRHPYEVFHKSVPMFNGWIPTEDGIRKARRLRDEVENDYYTFVARFTGEPSVALEPDIFAHIAPRVADDQSVPQLKSFGAETLGDLNSGVTHAAILWRDPHRTVGKQIEVTPLPESIPLYALIAPHHPAAEKLWKPGAKTITLDQLLACGGDLSVAYPQIPQIERFVRKYLDSTKTRRGHLSGPIVQAVINYVRAENRYIGLIPGWIGMRREIERNYGVVMLKVLVPGTSTGAIHPLGDGGDGGAGSTSRKRTRKETESAPESIDEGLAPYLLQMELLTGKQRDLSPVDDYVKRLRRLLGSDQPLIDWQRGIEVVPSLDEIDRFSGPDGFHYYYLTQGQDDGLIPITQICKTAFLRRKRMGDPEIWHLQIGAPINRSFDVHVDHVEYSSTETRRGHSFINIGSRDRPFSAVLTHRMEVPIDGGADKSKIICLAGSMSFLTERNVCANSAVLVTNVDLMAEKYLKYQLVNEFLRSGIVRSFNQPTEFQAPYKPTNA